MKIEFFMAMKTPTTTFQAKKLTVKNNKAIIYESAQAKKVRTLLLGHLAKYAPQKPLEGSVSLQVIWCYSAITGKHFDGEFKPTKPDIDNLQKLLLDCMTQTGFWKDDQQIVRLEATKVWNTIPGIYIKLDDESTRSCPVCGTPGVLEVKEYSGRYQVSCVACGHRSEWESTSEEAFHNLSKTGKWNRGVGNDRR